MSTRFSLNVENERADAGLDDQTHIARPNSQARKGTGKKTHFPCSADHEQDWQSYSVDSDSAKKVLIIHTYIHAYSIGRTSMAPYGDNIFIDNNNLAFTLERFGKMVHSVFPSAGNHLGIFCGGAAVLFVTKISQNPC